MELGHVTYARQSRDGAEVGSDFGLAYIPFDSEAEERMSPTLPVWSGPTSTSGPRPGDALCQYGYGRVLGKNYHTRARAGVAAYTFLDGSWVGVLPNSAGDSGSPVVTCETEEWGDLHGRAAVAIVTHGLGVYAAGTIVPKATDLAKEAGLNLHVWTS